jgi:hypothetical protein
MNEIRFDLAAPLIALILASAWSIFSSRLGRRMLIAKLGNELSAEQIAMIHNIAQDRILQTNCVVSILSFFSTVASATREPQVWVIVCLVVMGVVEVFVLADVFSRSLGSHATDILRFRWNRRKWTRENIYNMSIGVLSCFELYIVWQSGQLAAATKL